MISDRKLKQNQTKKKPLLIKLLKGVINTILLFSLFLLGTFLYENIASKIETEKYLPPGELVNVNHHKIHMDVKGNGTPTIIFESGYGATSTYWNKVAPLLHDKATVVTYDRAGYGWSEGTNLPRTGNNIVDDLHKALVKNNLKGPYILVAHSIGAQYTRLFAEKFSNEIEGMILIDGRSEYFGERSKVIFKKAGIDPEKAESQPIGLYRFLKFSGILRLFQEPILGSVYKTEEERDIAVNVNYTFKFFNVMEREPKGYPKLERQLEGQTFGDLPLTIISQSGKHATKMPGLSTEENKEMARIWREEQEKMANLSSDNRWVIAEKSGHDIAIDEPDLVVEEIENMLKRIGSKE